jgi:hypothetical protein
MKKITASTTVYPLVTARMKNTIPRMMAKIPIVAISLLISFLIRVSGLLIDVVALAMFPKKVLSPVEKTTQVPEPEVKLQPDLAIFLAS